MKVCKYSHGSRRMIAKDSGELRNYTCILYNSDHKQECMVSIASYKSSLIQHSVHSVNDGMIKRGEL